MADDQFPTDGSFVPSPAQTAYADQQFAATTRALDALLTETMLSVDLGQSGVPLQVSVGLRAADEVLALLGDDADEDLATGAALALAAAAIVRLAATESDVAAAESRGRTAGYAEAVAKIRQTAFTNGPLFTPLQIAAFLEAVAPSATTEEPRP